MFQKNVITIAYSQFLSDLNTDRKSTRLNSSHSQISYAVFCLKKKNKPLASTLVAIKLLGVHRPHPPFHIPLCTSASFLPSAPDPALALGTPRPDHDHPHSYR